MPETTKKSFLELGEPDPITGFRGIQFESVSASTLDAFLGAEKSEPAGGFRLSDEHWRALEKDPEIRKDLEKLVDARVEERLKQQEEPARAALFEEARRQGIELGSEQARREFQKAMARLDAIAMTVLKEKEALLHSHEKLWADTFAHLLRRFLVPRGPELVERIREWMREALTDYSSKERVEIFVSSGELDRLRTAGVLEAEPHWTLRADSKLADGEIRVECGGSGASFFPEKALAELEAWTRGEMAVPSPKGGAA